MSGAPSGDAGPSEPAGPGPKVEAARFIRDEVPQKPLEPAEARAAQGQTAEWRDQLNAEPLFTRTLGKRAPHAPDDDAQEDAAQTSREAAKGSPHRLLAARPAAEESLMVRTARDEEEGSEHPVYSMADHPLRDIRDAAPDGGQAVVQDDGFRPDAVLQRLDSALGQGAVNETMDIPLDFVTTNRGGSVFPMGYFGRRGEDAIRRTMGQLRHKMTAIGDQVGGLLQDARHEATARARRDKIAMEALGAMLDRTQGMYVDFRTDMRASGPREVSVSKRPAPGPLGAVSRGVAAALGGTAAPGERVTHHEFAGTLRSEGAQQKRPRRLDPLAGETTALTVVREGQAPGRPTSAGGAHAAMVSSMPPATDAGRPGSAQGGRGAHAHSHVDRLHWVRALVSASDQPLRSSVGGRSMSTAKSATTKQLGSMAIGQARSMPQDQAVPSAVRMAGMQRGPAAQPAQRDGAVALGAWLSDIMDAMQLKVHRKWSAAADTPPGVSVDAAPETPLIDAADGVLYVYSIAADELRRQVTSECRERGDLMGALWDHTFRLTELRAAIRHQAQIEALTQDCRRRQAEIDRLQELLKAADSVQESTRGDHDHQVHQMITENRNIAAKYVAEKGRAKGLQEDLDATEARLKDEIARRLKVEGVLAGYDRKVARAEDAAADLREKLAASEARASDLDGSLDKLRFEFEELSIKFTAASEDLADTKEELAKQLENLRVQRDMAVRVQRDLVTRDGELAMTKDHLLKERDLHKETMAAVEAATKAVQSAKDESSSLGAQLQKEIANAREKDQMLERMREELERRDNVAKERRAQHNQDIAEMQVLVDRERSRADGAESLVRDLDQKRRLLESDLDVAHRELEKERTEVAHLRGQCRRLLETLNVEASSVESVQQALHMLDRDWAFYKVHSKSHMTLQAAMNATQWFNKNLSELRTEAAQWRSAAQESGARAETAENEVLDAKTKAEKSARERDLMKKQHDKMADEWNSLRSQIDSLRRQVDGLTLQLTETRSNFGRKAREVEKLNAQLATYKESDSTLKGMLAEEGVEGVSGVEDVVSYVTTVTKECKQMHLQLEEKNIAIVNNTRVAAQLQSQIHELNGEIGDLRMSNYELQLELTPLRHERDLMAAAASGLLQKNKALVTATTKACSSLRMAQTLLQSSGIMGALTGTQVSVVLPNAMLAPPQLHQVNPHGVVATGTAEGEALAMHMVRRFRGGEPMPEKLFQDTLEAMGLGSEDKGLQFGPDGALDVLLIPSRPGSPEIKMTVDFDPNTPMAPADEILRLDHNDGTDMPRRRVQDELRRFADLDEANAELERLRAREEQHSARGTLAAQLAQQFNAAERTVDRDAAWKRIELMMLEHVNDRMMAIAEREERCAGPNARHKEAGALVAEYEQLRIDSQEIRQILETDCSEEEAQEAQALIEQAHERMTAITKQVAEICAADRAHLAELENAVQRAAEDLSTKRSMISLVQEDRARAEQSGMHADVRRLEGEIRVHQKTFEPARRRAAVLGSLVRHARWLLAMHEAEVSRGTEFRVHLLGVELSNLQVGRDLNEAPSERETEVAAALGAAEEELNFARTRLAETEKAIEAGMKDLVAARTQSAVELELTEHDMRPLWETVNGLLVQIKHAKRRAATDEEMEHDHGGDPSKGVSAQAAEQLVSAMRAVADMSAKLDGKIEWRGQSERAISQDYTRHALRRAALARSTLLLIQDMQPDIGLATASAEQRIRADMDRLRAEADRCIELQQVEDRNRIKEVSTLSDARLKAYQVVQRLEAAAATISLEMETLPTSHPVRKSLSRSWNTCCGLLTSARRRESLATGQLVAALDSASRACNVWITRWQLQRAAAEEVLRRVAAGQAVEELKVEGGRAQVEKRAREAGKQQLQWVELQGEVAEKLKALKEPLKDRLANRTDALRDAHIEVRIVRDSMRAAKASRSVGLAAAGSEADGAGADSPRRDAAPGEDARKQREKMLKKGRTVVLLNEVDLPVAEANVSSLASTVHALRAISKLVSSIENRVAGSDRPAVTTAQDLVDACRFETARYQREHDDVSAVVRQMTASPYTRRVKRDNASISSRPSTADTTGSARMDRDSFAERPRTPNFGRPGTAQSRDGSIRPASRLARTSGDHDIRDFRPSSSQQNRWRPASREQPQQGQRLSVSIPGGHDSGALTEGSHARVDVCSLGPSSPGGLSVLAERGASPATMRQHQTALSDYQPVAQVRLITNVFDFIRAEVDTDLNDLDMDARRDLRQRVVEEYGGQKLVTLDREMRDELLREAMEDPDLLEAGLRLLQPKKTPSGNIKETAASRRERAREAAKRAGHRRTGSGAVQPASPQSGIGVDPGAEREFSKHEKIVQQMMKRLKKSYETGAAPGVADLDDAPPTPGAKPPTPSQKPALNRAQGKSIAAPRVRPPTDLLKELEEKMLADGRMIESLRNRLWEQGAQSRDAKAALQAEEEKTRALTKKLRWVTAGRDIMGGWAKGLRVRMGNLEAQNRGLIEAVDGLKIDTLELLKSQQASLARRVMQELHVHKRVAGEYQKRAQQAADEVSVLKEALFRAREQEQRIESFMSSLEGQRRARRDAGIQTARSMMEQWLPWLKDTMARRKDVRMIGLNSLLEHIAGAFLNRMDHILATRANQQEHGAHGAAQHTQEVVVPVDAMLAYVAAQQIDGGIFIRGHTGFMAQFIVSVHMMANNHPRIALFARMLGVGAEDAPSDPLFGDLTFGFLLQVLLCIKKLMGLKFRILAKEWRAGPAHLPHNVALDVLANLWNSDDPTQLAVFQQRLAPSARERGTSGVTIDLDIFLDALASAFNSETLPRDALSEPRRLGAAAQDRAAQASKKPQGAGFRKKPEHGESSDSMGGASGRLSPHAEGQEEGGDDHEEDMAPAEHMAALQQRAASRGRSGRPRLVVEPIIEEGSGEMEGEESGNSPGGRGAPSRGGSGLRPHYLPQDDPEEIVRQSIALADEQVRGSRIDSAAEGDRASPAMVRRTPPPPIPRKANSRMSPELAASLRDSDGDRSRSPLSAGRSRAMLGGTPSLSQAGMARLMQAEQAEREAETAPAGLGTGASFRGRSMRSMQSLAWRTTSRRDGIGAIPEDAPSAPRTPEEETAAVPSLQYVPSMARTFGRSRLSSLVAVRENERQE
ncbi:unnamed protein product [Pedinophyceae sp. YPF-701]|nr:unnamed protein product [Pedinophyceae sp. YPF-701]